MIFITRFMKKTSDLQQLEDLAAMFAASGHACEYNGLSYGKMGMVIFLFHYARQIRDASFEEAAEALIGEIQAAVHSDFPLNFAYGLTGIGTGIEYLAQQHFLDIDTDDLLDEFDRMFAGQIHTQKLYLSSQDLTDMKRFFLARLENPQTGKRDFLTDTINDIVALQELHDRVSPPAAYRIRMPASELSANWGIEGQAGAGLSLLSAINPQHNSWLQLKL